MIITRNELDPLLDEIGSIISLAYKSGAADIKYIYANSVESTSLKEESRRASEAKLAAYKAIVEKFYRSIKD